MITYIIKTEKGEWLKMDECGQPYFYIHLAFWTFIAILIVSVAFWCITHNPPMMLLTLNGTI